MISSGRLLGCDHKLHALVQQELNIKVKPWVFKVAGRELSILLIHEVVAWLASQPMQAMVSLLGPSGKNGPKEFWETASKYEWGRKHVVVREGSWMAGAHANDVADC